MTYRIEGIQGKVQTPPSLTTERPSLWPDLGKGFLTNCFYWAYLEGPTDWWLCTGMAEKVSLQKWKQAQQMLNLFCNPYSNPVTQEGISASFPMLNR